MKQFKIETLAWQKMHDLIPAIVQDAHSGKVLMLGYMNQAALTQTCQTQWVTFYSRSKKRLWVKGETSGNKLKLVDISADCDSDCLLILAHPKGPTCHHGTATCFTKNFNPLWQVLSKLEKIIEQRDQQRPQGSYISELLQAGVNRIAQKVGEEGVEVALAGVSQDDQALCNEAADLLFHLMVLLQAKKLKLNAVLAVLVGRMV